MWVAGVRREAHRFWPCRLGSAAWTCGVSTAASQATLRYAISSVAPLPLPLPSPSRLAPWFRSGCCSPAPSSQLPCLVLPPFALPIADTHTASPSDSRPSHPPILRISRSPSLFSSTKRPSTSTSPSPPLAPIQPPALRSRHLFLPRLHLPAPAVPAPYVPKSRPGWVLSHIHSAHFCLASSARLCRRLRVTHTRRSTFRRARATASKPQRTIPGSNDGTTTRRIPACGYNSSSPLFRCIAFIFRRAHVQPLRLDPLVEPFP